MAVLGKIQPAHSILHPRSEGLEPTLLDIYISVRAYIHTCMCIRTRGSTTVHMPTGFDNPIQSLAPVLLLVPLHLHLPCIYEMLAPPNARPRPRCVEAFPALNCSTKHVYIYIYIYYM